MIQDLNSKKPLVSDIKLTWHAVLKKLNKNMVMKFTIAG